jgi:hypothetical protein
MIRGAQVSDIVCRVSPVELDLWDGPCPHANCVRGASSHTAQQSVATHQVREQLHDESVLRYRTERVHFEPTVGSSAAQRVERARHIHHLQYEDIVSVEP